jgi:uncharacterized tellurite resistance protein B-like protein
MLDRLLKLLTAPETEPAPQDDLQVAVAVLLVEAARMDAEFDEKERAAIQRLLAQRFSLSADTAGQLIALAESKAERSNQLYPFTRIAVERMDEQQRIRLIEMLWEVVYADGTLDADEDALIRRVAGLIYVSDQDRGGARQRVLARLNPQGKGPWG